MCTLVISLALKMPNKTLWWISWIVFFLYIGVSAVRFDEFGLNVKQQILRYGYPLEIHTVITVDEYILEAHRIPHGKNNANLTSRPPVLLMPGLACSSADWISSGPNNGLGYMLADLGYDVWLVNYRGTTWSRKHTKLDPNSSKQFWDYSANEIAYYDTRSFIDYILETTKHEQLYYIGHSQGGMVIFMLISEKPEYNKKIRLMVLLAPASFLPNSKSIFFPVLYNFHKDFWKILRTWHMYEVFSHSPLLTAILQLICNPRFEYRVLCNIAYLILSGNQPKHIDKDRFPVLYNNFPAGTSFKQLQYFRQLYSADKVLKYDYGDAENLIRYGVSTPPAYNISAVTVPSAFYYGDSDALVDSKDTARTADMFPNIVANVLIKGYSHFDFIWGVDAKEMLYNNITNLMRMF